MQSWRFFLHIAIPLMHEVPAVSYIQGGCSDTEHLTLFVHTVVNFRASVRSEERLVKRDVPNSWMILPYRWTLQILRQLYRRNLEIAPMCEATQMRGKTTCLPSQHHQLNESGTVLVKKKIAAHFQLAQDLFYAPP